MGAVGGHMCQYSTVDSRGAVAAGQAVLVGPVVGVIAEMA